jgi:general transcriptional corepressor CYC8
MATQHSPDGPLSHPQHYPPPLRQPPNAGMPIPQPQQLKNSAAQWLAQTNEDVWLRLGGLSENLGDLDGATQAYERAMHHNAWSIQAMLAISCILRSKDQFTAAVEYLRSILKIESTNGEVWSSLGHCYLMMDDLQRRTGLIGQTISGLTFQQSQTRFDMNVVGVQVRGSRICVECIARLVITRFILKLR